MNNFRLITLTALRVAKQAIADKALDTMSITQIAERENLARGTLSYAILIYEYGTPEEIQMAESGDFGLKALREMVKAHMTTEQRHALATRIGKHTADRSEKTRAEAILWRKFAPMLQNVNDLPAPADMVKLVPRVARRDITVNKYLTKAISYLEEFSREWAKHQRTTASGDNPDA